MTGKQWIILLVAFSMSFCCCGGLLILQRQGLDVMASDTGIDLAPEPGDTIPTYIVTKQTEAILHRAGQIFMPVIVLITMVLGAGIMVGAIAEAAKRL